MQIFLYGMIVICIICDDYKHIKNCMKQTIWSWKLPYLQARMVSIALWSKQTFHIHSLHFGISCSYMYSLWIFHPIIVWLRGCCKYRVSTSDPSLSWVHILFRPSQSVSSGLPYLATKGVNILNLVILFL